MDTMTKTQQIADSLLERIQRRQLCGRIPSGKVIAEEYHVALMTAVNALKILEKKGYVIRIPRKGNRRERRHCFGCPDRLSKEIPL